MARPKDSEDLSALKKTYTKKFIALIEANTNAGPKALENALGIGDGTGIVWCAYRRGNRAMALETTLLPKIALAIKKGYISPVDAKVLEKEILDQKHAVEMAQYLNERYVYDPRPYEFAQFTEAAQELVAQANNLAANHACSDILAAFKPLQELILEFSGRKDEPSKQLKPKEPVEFLLQREIEGKWGEWVPESTVRKLFGRNHGIEMRDGFASSHDVALKMAEMRNEALNATR